MKQRNRTLSIHKTKKPSSAAKRTVTRQTFPKGGSVVASGKRKLSEPNINVPFRDTGEQSYARMLKEAAQYDRAKAKRAREDVAAEAARIDAERIAKQRASADRSLQYMHPEFVQKHIRYAPPESPPNYLVGEAQKEASRRYSGQRAPSGSTMIGMDRGTLKDLRRFIVDPATQKDLRAERAVSFPIQHNPMPPKQRVASAVKISPGGSAEQYTNPGRGFNEFSFSSIRKGPGVPQPEHNGSVMPNHFEYIAPSQGAPLALNKKVKF